MTDLQLIAGGVLLLSLLGLAYIYVGYPVLIAVAARLGGRERRREANALTASVVICCADEEGRIADKLASVFASEGAEQIIEVVVVCDGSTDRTADVVRAYDDPRTRVIELPRRSGKPTALNMAIPTCLGDVLILTDARQRLGAEAVKALLSNFSDDRIGVVSGELVFESDPESTTAAEGIGFYWTYEKFIRKSESRFRGVPGATGALYAIRRQLAEPLPPSTLLDDVLLPMGAVMRGSRCVFESRAVAYDRPTRNAGQESIRKRRTIAGVAQLCLLRPSLLLPIVNPIWFEFVSHKVLRLVSPLLLITALIANVLCLPAVWAWCVLGLQLTGYALAGLGWLGQRFGRRSRLLGPALMFLTLNVTTVLALWDAMRGRFRVTWTRAAIPEANTNSDANATEESTVNESEQNIREKVLT